MKNFLASLSLMLLATGAFADAITDRANTITSATGCTNLKPVMATNGTVAFWSGHCPRDGVNDNTSPSALAVGALNVYAGFIALDNKDFDALKPPVVD